MGRRLVAIAATASVIVLLGISGVGLAVAATREDKLAMLSRWTSPSVNSYNAWNAARTDQSAWADYDFDWSTDYCSSSPDRPLGFDFRLPCHRHDFGYHNYDAMDEFSDNKDRVDDAFHEDLLRRCDTYSALLRPACDSLAWSYYQAVRAFGSVRITEQDLDRARSLLPDEESYSEPRRRGPLN